LGQLETTFASPDAEGASPVKKARREKKLKDSELDGEIVKGVWGNMDGPRRECADFTKTKHSRSISISTKPIHSNLLKNVGAQAPSNPIPSAARRFLSVADLSSVLHRVLQVGANCRSSPRMPAAPIAWILLYACGRSRGYRCESYPPAIPSRSTPLRCVCFVLGTRVRRLVWETRAQIGVPEMGRDVEMGREEERGRMAKGERRRERWIETWGVEAI